MMRPYQQELVSAAVRTKCNALIRADTGAGKTRVLAEVARVESEKGDVIVTAHRNALVAQLSLEFAKLGIRHVMLCSKSTRRRAELLQRRELGVCFHDSAAPVVIASVDTVMARHARGTLALKTDGFVAVLIDECHHVTAQNKWGRLCALFENARVFGTTATPDRLDGVPLRKGSGGVFEEMLEASELKRDSVATLIKMGFLSPFKCYATEKRFDVRNLKMGAHDYTDASMCAEFGRHVQVMAGDAVKHYKRLADGKPAVAFCVSIKLAEKTAKVFRNAGISAAAIHSKMSQTDVERVFDLFKEKRISVLCNVDMTGEGVDIPAIEALIMLRKTASLTLYRQWVGRTLRPCDGKTHAIIIDHAGNVEAHGLPDGHIEWSLDGAPQATRSELEECPACGYVFKKYEDKCPECDTSRRGEQGRGRSVLTVGAELVEVHSTREAEKLRNSQRAADVPKNEVKYLAAPGAKMAEVSNKVATWFYESVKQHVELGELEEFLYANNKLAFWASKFKLSDLSQLNTEKCMRVFSEHKNSKR